MGIINFYLTCKTKELSSRLAAVLSLLPVLLSSLFDLKTKPKWEQMETWPHKIMNIFLMFLHTERTIKPHPSSNKDNPIGLQQIYRSRPIIVTQKLLVPLDTTICLIGLSLNWNPLKVFRKFYKQVALLPPLPILMAHHQPMELIGLLKIW